MEGQKKNPLIESLNAAIFQVKKVLFSPFDFKKWLFYGIISVFNCSIVNINININKPDTRINSLYSITDRIPSEQIITITVFFILFTLIIALLTIYLSANFRYVLMESILQKKMHLKEYWAKHKLRSKNYFLWIVKICSRIFLAALMFVFGFIIIISSTGNTLAMIASVLLHIILIVIIVKIIIYIFIVNTVVLPVTLHRDPSEKSGSIEEIWKSLQPEIKQKSWILFLYWLLTVVYGIFQNIVIFIICLPAIILYAGLTFISGFTGPTLLLLLFIPATAAVTVILYILIISPVAAPLGVFQISWQMALSGRLFPKYQTLIMEKDAFGKIIASKNLYEIAMEKSETEKNEIGADAITADPFTQI